MLGQKLLHCIDYQPIFPPALNYNRLAIHPAVEGSAERVCASWGGDKINNMNQQRPYLNKPVKSLSARAFARSALKPPASRRNETLPTEPIQLFSQTKRQYELQGKSSRLLAFANPSKRSGLKQPEQLQEENTSLKLKLHQLNSVLGKERTKNGREKKNYSKVHEKLEAEFSDDKYFDLSAKNGNLVDGVKHQYYKMKQKYEDKCIEYDALLKRAACLVDQENKAYMEAIQSDNIKLKNRLAALVNLEEKLEEELKKKQDNTNTRTGILKNKTERSNREDELFELLGLSSEFTLLEKKLVDSQYKLQQYEQRIATLKLNIRNKRKKIEFLDKLLREKSNEVHHAVLKERKLAKQNKQQAEALEKLQKQLKQQYDEHQTTLDMLRKKQEVRFQTQKNIFSKCLKEKDAEIEKLKQEIYYLTTIISYIKTGEDPCKIENVPTNLSKKNSYNDHSSQFLQNLEKTLISIQGDNLNTRKRVKTLIESGFKEANSPRQQGNTENLKAIQVVSDSENEGESVVGSFLRNTQLEDIVVESRVPKKSNLKHSAGAVKVRSVKPSQIDSLKKELVYRFMFYRLHIDEAKEFFNLNEEISLSKREKRWRTQYATLKEIKDKLQAYPFDLKQEQALLLSRYIVEDCTKDNVYYHEENEVERTIAKSILRAFVGEYSVPVEESAKAELRAVLGKSGKNLQSALTSLAPTGFISSLKFCEICQSIQIDFSEEARNYILSQLLAKSAEGLANLQYGLIFSALAQ